MHLMRRAAALEEDQIDRVVNSMKKRLARMLLMLASLDAENAGGRVLERITEGTLAKMLAADPPCSGEVSGINQSPAAVTSRTREVVCSPI
ncbi:hypothetical protein CT676_38170 [Bradyrhizobium sp. MOS001]|uniref:hypothetical protein n=1 Tax=Bradyrhizobium sp. MOS001 TaxID=2133948 RepID=UPI001074F859|nr:hypothetical protein [Bradyrhizobium sp. MOS001]TFW55891.1 hypothetical protein CT676_38170 [Bradyrhizobium sp. MOS001]